MNYLSPEEALDGLRSGMRVFIGSGCAAPQKLVTSLAARGSEVFDVEVVHILTFGAADYARADLLRFRADNKRFRTMLQETVGSVDSTLEGEFLCVRFPLPAKAQ